MGRLMQNSISSAREAALRLIEPSVEYGKSFDQIRNSFLIHNSELFIASIGGYIGQRWISSKFVVVKALNGTPIQPKIFELQEIYTQVRRRFYAGNFSSTNPLLVAKSQKRAKHVQKMLF